MYRTTENKKSFVIHGKLGDSIIVSKETGDLKCHLTCTYTPNELSTLISKAMTVAEIAVDVHKFRIWKRKDAYYCILGPAGEVFAECNNAKHWGKYGFLCVVIEGSMGGQTVYEDGVNLLMRGVRNYYLTVDTLESGKEIWSTSARVNYLYINNEMIARWTYRE